MELSIVVTSYKNPSLLKLCLNSILDDVTDIEHEIFVSDSATEEETEMLMREEFSRVKFFPFKKNVGFQAVAKKGIEAGSGKYILLLNGDIIVAKGAIKKLLDFMKSDSETGIAGPKLLNFNGGLQYSCFRFYKPLTIIYRRTFLSKLGFAKKHLDWFLMKDYDHATPRDVDWVMGSAMIINRSAMEKVGLMDERLFMYMEDVDWCRRFWEAGYKVMFYPHSEMHHYHGRGSAKGGLLRSLFLNKYTWIHISSALKYFSKYLGKSNPHRENVF